MNSELQGHGYNRQLKTLLTCSLFFICASVTKAQSGMWTWMKGDSTSCNLSSNEPSCRYAVAQWTDTTGNFWIYNSSDLWKYDPQLNTWTNTCGIPNDTIRILSPKGVFNPQNNPGAKVNGVYTWTTSDNTLWMYGGIGQQDGCAMLWKYSITLNQWAWMGTFATENYGIKGVADSANMPGCSDETNAAWIDASGNLWLFGAGNYPGNNMWKYDISSGLWTWMSGSNNSDAGQYGTIGVPSVNNYPSSRWSNFYWKDDTGNFWVGLGHATVTDIWKFNPLTLEWTWMKGSPNATICTPIGNLCDTSSINQAGSRFENRTTWKISDKLILTYAGQGCGVPHYNDIWAYLPLESKWIKIGDYPVAGHFGTKGVPSPLDYPNWRTGAAGFKDIYNNCWVFSGFTTGVISNDLWKYQIDWNCLPSNISVIDNLSDENTLSVYPNPAFNELNISLSHSEFAEQVRIFNTLGQLFRDLKLSVNSSIDVSDLPKGVYIAEIKFKQTILKKLWIKM